MIFENIVANEEIAQRGEFLIRWKCFKHFHKNLYQMTVLDVTKLKVFADDKIENDSKNEICFGNVRKYCGKR